MKRLVGGMVLGMFGAMALLGFALQPTPQENQPLGITLGAIAISVLMVVGGIILIYFGAMDIRRHRMP